ncbi:Lsr2 family protein [Marmoricola endophyticus]|uniref:Lsr2 family protein n=1 Tax=Marmoricola endophyticus TaxID=2040280 RepID=A0A917BIL9_9ACTN|nr:Lsr2 family protein [Marmoricola endophyticus]GGF44971.1 Lsr2 family protein [Marmoricola endophyticus]
MAQKVNIVLIDDIDESEADETVSFGLDGKEYLIDLTAEHAGQLRDALAPYVGHARPAGRRSATRKSAAAAPRSSSDATAIREWARGNGFDVPERGRLPKEVKEAYESAH